MVKFGPPRSDLVEIARRNGDFKRNYGTLLGALLYLRSLRCGMRTPRRLDRLVPGADSGSPLAGHEVQLEMAVMRLTAGRC